MSIVACLHRPEKGKKKKRRRKKKKRKKEASETISSRACDESHKRTPTPSVMSQISFHFLDSESQSMITSEKKKQEKERGGGDEDGKVVSKGVRIGALGRNADSGRLPAPVPVPVPVPAVRDVDPLSRFIRPHHVPLGRQRKHAIADKNKHHRPLEVWAALWTTTPRSGSPCLIFTLAELGKYSTSSPPKWLSSKTLGQSWLT